MQIHCPRCHAKIAARSIHLERMVAKCDACDEVFGIDATSGAAPASTRVPQPPSIELIGDPPAGPVPDAFRIPARQARGRIELRYRWFAPTAIFMLVFSVGWWAFLIFWYWTAITHDGPWIMFVFPLIHVAAGIVILYSALATLLNRTTITVDDSMLRVRHHPIPWRGARDLEASSIRQLHVRRRTSRGRRSDRVSYALTADVEGRAVDLVSGLARHDEARFLEQTLEAHLGIPDDPAANDPA